MCESRINEAKWDRGPAKYFHGRKEILRDFRELLECSVQEKSGTIFLIQGAPGAGKSALLHECGELARGTGWEVAKLRYSASSFWDPVMMSEDMGDSGIKVKKRFPTVLDLLRSGESPLLLMEDEVQCFRLFPHPPAARGVTMTSVLNAIHHGKLNRPVILATAGLGISAEVFASFGISRFEEKCLVELGSLDKEAERAVMHDWLTKHGEANGDPAPWIDAITRETHGWPCQIMWYMADAVDQLWANNGAMTAEGLDTVLKEGREYQDRYCGHQVNGFDNGGLSTIANLFAKAPLGEGIPRETILDALQEDPMAFGEAEDILHHAVHKGVLDGRAGRYVVSTPTLQEWLVDYHGRFRKRRGPLRLAHHSPT